jgi:hypothetical protein
MRCGIEVFTGGAELTGGGLRFIGILGAGLMMGQDQQTDR